LNRPSAHHRWGVDGRVRPGHDGWATSLDQHENDSRMTGNRMTRNRMTRNRVPPNRIPPNLASLLA